MYDPIIGKVNMKEVNIKAEDIKGIPTLTETLTKNGDMTRRCIDVANTIYNYFFYESHAVNENNPFVETNPNILDEAIEQGEALECLLDMLIEIKNRIG